MFRNTALMFIVIEANNYTHSPRRYLDPLKFILITSTVFNMEISRDIALMFVVIEADNYSHSPSRYSDPLRFFL